jgi:membrane protein
MNARMDMLLRSSRRPLARVGSVRRPIEKFFADRGPHLAAMIAYFALLSFVPLLFLTLAMLGLAGRADESTYVVTELKNAFPGASVDTIVSTVRSVQRNAATLGILGAVLLAWTSLSLFSVLESAFNIVYGRPNRSFLHGKGIAVLLLFGTLVTLFVGLLAGSFGAGVLRHYAPSVIGNDTVARLLSLLISSLTIFVFLVTVYTLLTNVKIDVRSTVPGALVATVLLETTVQLLPLYGEYAKENVTLRIGSPAVLIVWLYLMANVIVFGAEINYWWSHREGEGRGAEEVPGLA